MNEKEILKRQKEIKKEIDGINKEINAKYQEISKLNKEQHKLEMELLKKKVKIESGKSYIKFDDIDYHYTIYTIYSVKDINNSTVSYIECKFRSDDYELSFHTNATVSGNAKMFLKGLAGVKIYELSDNDNIEILYAGMNLDLEGVETLKKKIIEKDGGDNV